MQVPAIIEKTGRGEAVYDIYSRLLKDRIVMLSGEIDDDSANSIIAQMLFLETEDSDKDIYMYINSPGGVITAGLAIYDTMKLIKPNVITICIGQAASMGAFLLSAGDKRYSLPNSRIMIHQPLGGAGGQASDIEIQAKEILFLKSSLNKLLAKHTGQPIDKIEKDTDRDFFMSSEEAVEYGLVDSVLDKKIKK